MFYSQGKKWGWQVKQVFFFFGRKNFKKGGKPFWIGLGGVGGLKEVPQELQWGKEEFFFCL